jgi:hypothetical protein
MDSQSNRFRYWLETTVFEQYQLIGVVGLALTVVTIAVLLRVFAPRYLDQLQGANQQAADTVAARASAPPLDRSLPSLLVTPSPSAAPTVAPTAAATHRAVPTARPTRRPTAPPGPSPSPTATPTPLLSPPLPTPSLPLPSPSPSL